MGLYQYLNDNSSNDFENFRHAIQDFLFMNYYDYSYFKNVLNMVF